MEYFANIKEFQNTFSVPKSVAQNYLKIATPTQLKVLLYVLNNLADDPSSEDISSFLSIPVSDVKDALAFWATADIFISKSGNEKAPQTKEKAKIIKSQIVKPSKEEIVRQSRENKELALLLHEAEGKFARVLTFGEIQTLSWLFIEQGLDISLILMLLEYASNENRLNIGFIERTAIEWLNNGVEDISSAERYITETYEKRTAWKIVETTFGIDSRRPSEKELSLSYLWVKEWGFSREILKLAYDKCIDAKSKLIMSYIGKILEGWHKNGYKTLEDIKKGEENPQNAGINHSYSTTSIEEYEKIINQD